MKTGKPGTRIGARGRAIPLSMREGTLGGSPFGRSAPILVPGFLAILVVACSSTATSSGGADAGYCESNGYSSPAGSTCSKGTCMASGTPVGCCGSLCPTCESKGLASYDAGGMCPSGLCPSADATGTLQCCDTCGPLNAEAGADAPPETGHPEASSGADASEEAGD